MREARAAEGRGACRAATVVLKRGVKLLLFLLLLLLLFVLLLCCCCSCYVCRSVSLAAISRDGNQRITAVLATKV